MIYLVRHGQTVWNLEHRLQGQLDISLNTTGQDEAALCAKQLSAIKIDKIISSDLSRAKETAMIISKSLSLPLAFDSRLKELNCGDLQGHVIKEVPWHTFIHDPHKFNSEPLADFYDRLKSFFKELDEIQNTVIVTHTGVVKMIMHLAYHPDSYDRADFEQTALQFKVRNGEIFTWDKEQRFQLLANEAFQKSDRLAY